MSAASAGVKLRRSAHLAAYWKADRFTLRHVITGVECAADAAVLAVLERAGGPTARSELRAATQGAGDALIDRLLAAGLLVASGDSAPGDGAQDGWRGWSPEAALFHFGTKDYPFRQRPSDELTVIGPQRPPDPLKQDPPGVTRIELPPFPRRGPIPETLLQRRTWRRFAHRPLQLPELATLAGLTWAVQRWSPGLQDVRLAFKTSPSGGAKHSIEAYVAAARVDGLAPATYHYCPDRHGLARVAELPSREQLAAFLPAQPFYAEAAAVFFMTSVFGRVQAKYRFARAYRVVQIEAGHLAQTFCLLATWLRLAPFCTAALGDTAIERHLGIDGVGESVLYVTGVGVRPEGVDWAPFGDGREAPETTSPSYRERDPHV
jgi:SagB-type dehydrogenase family enzyme